MITVPVAAASAAALTAMVATHLVVPPRRALAQRLRPYSALSRSRLGTGYADVSVVSLTLVDDRSALARVLGPMLDRLAHGLSRLLDAADAETIASRLRHAGFTSVGPEQYRMRQLAFTVAGVGIGATIGGAVLRSASLTLLLIGCFGFPAATLQRNRIDRSIRDRTARMRNESYTVAQLIAVHLRSGHGPVDAVRSVCALGRGPVIEELREALGWIGGGMSPQRAYDKLAESTPEPSAARLYRLLSASARSGGDISLALLAVGSELRSERRDELARHAVRRRAAMLLPLLLFIAPVMVLFVGAALPALVMGR
jgi:tight adherence protein C